MNKTYKCGDLVKVQYRPGYSNFKFGAESKHNGASGVITAYDENDNTYRVEIENRGIWFHAEEITLLEKSQIQEPRFKIGDKVTFKPRAQCVLQDGTPNQYYFGGNDQAGIVGKVIHIGDKSSKNCYVIEVSFLDEKRIGCSYTMLESEMVEYDQISSLPSVSKSKKTSLNFSY